MNHHSYCIVLELKLRQNNVIYKRIFRYFVLTLTLFLKKSTPRLYTLVSTNENKIGIKKKCFDFRRADLVIPISLDSVTHEKRMHKQFYLLPYFS